MNVLVADGLSVEVGAGVDDGSGVSVLAGTDVLVGLFGPLLFDDSVGCGVWGSGT